MGIVAINRRQFLRGSLALVGLTLLPGCAALLPRERQPTTVPQVGWLQLGTGSGRYEAFTRSLHELGYIDSQSVRLAFHGGETRESLTDLALDLVRLPASVIVAASTVAAVAARDATHTVPIVAFSSDMVGAGLADSLARPGGNVTGVSSGIPDFAGKQLEQLRELLPGLARIAVLWYAEGPAVNLAFQEVQRAALALGLQVQSLEVRRPGDLVAALASATDQQAQALVVLQGGALGEQAAEIVEFSLRNRLPGSYPNRDFVEAGGLLSYALPRFDEERRAAVYVDKILRGARPADLPIEQPTQYELVVNLKTAVALGLTVPPTVLAQATEIIQ